MNVPNMSWNHSKFIYDSQINDSKCQLQSLCMPAFSQPWWEEQTQSHHVILFDHVSYPNNPNSTTSIPCTTRRRERSSFFHGLSDSITRECEETPIQWDAIGSDTEGRERLSVYICVSILSQETGEWQGETSCTCGRRILEWCWGEALQGWAIHFHLLQEVQSTTLNQQGEL